MKYFVVVVHSMYINKIISSYFNIPYKLNNNKFWQRTKFGELANRHKIAKFKISPILFSYHITRDTAVKAFVDVGFTIASIRRLLFVTQSKPFVWLMRLHTHTQLLILSNIEITCFNFCFNACSDWLYPQDRHFSTRRISAVQNECAFCQIKISPTANLYQIAKY